MQWVKGWSPCVSQGDTGHHGKATKLNAPWVPHAVLLIPVPTLEEVGTIVLHITKKRWMYTGIRQAHSGTETGV